MCRCRRSGYLPGSHVDLGASGAFHRRDRPNAGPLSGRHSTRRGPVLYLPLHQLRFDLALTCPESAGEDQRFLLGESAASSPSMDERWWWSSTRAFCAQRSGMSGVARYPSIPG